MPQVDGAGTRIGSFQVSGNVVVIEDEVVRVQQRRAGAAPLPIRADGQYGQVMVSKADRVVAVERRVEGLEPADPRADYRSQRLMVAVWRVRRESTDG